MQTGCLTRWPVILAVHAVADPNGLILGHVYAAAGAGKHPGYGGPIWGTAPVAMNEKADQAERDPYGQKNNKQPQQAATHVGRTSY